MKAMPGMMCAVLTRGALLLAFFAAGPAALADRVITVPTGYTLLPGEFRLEYLFFGEAPIKSFAFVNLGALQINEHYLEISAFRQEPPGQRAATGLNLQYSILQPYPDYAPGIAVGLTDIFSATENGPAAFIALTFQSNVVSDWAARERASVTIGASSRQSRPVFVGVVVPMFKGVTFVGEHTSRVLTAGFQVEPSKGFALRAFVRQNRPMFGAQYSRMF